jgi:hypothetical protein
LVALSLALSLALAACGGDDADGKRQAAADRTRQYCANKLTIETDPGPDLDIASLSLEQQKEEIRKYAQSRLRPLADKIVATAPKEISAEIGVLSDAVRQMEGGAQYEDAFGTPEVAAADKAVHDYDLGACGWRQVDVAAVDYTFSGVSSKLTPGPTSFDMTNNGGEHHEMVVFKKNDDVAETFDQILALPDAEAMKRVSFVAADEGMPKEEGIYAVADLKAGRYAMICFYPVGSTPEAVAAARASGKPIQGDPHWKKGMKAEFTVE